MAEPHIVTALHAKRDHLEGHIGYLEAQITAARIDLAHVSATLRLFEIGDEPLQFPVHMDLNRLFRRGEIVNLCRTALAASGEPMTTRELALNVVTAKGWNVDDKALRSAVAYRIVQALNMAAKRGRVSSPGKRAGVRVWIVELQRAGVCDRAALRP